MSPVRNATNSGHRDDESSAAEPVQEAPDTDAPDTDANDTELAHEVGASSASDRRRRIEKILVDADRRDEEATDRDTVSDDREKASDLKAFLDTDGTYAGHGERRAAAQDRSHAKHDRESSADDRAALTNPENDGEGSAYIGS